ncbi:MAG: hypothetical protein CMH57_13180 [Myxococcales bacterium]|nr:hypothetical protein [Myxococcales bacterium]
MAQLLAARFGVDAAEAEHAISDGPGLVRIASGVEEEKAQEVRDVLARIGVGAFVQPVHTGSRVKLGGGGPRLPTRRDLSDPDAALRVELPGAASSPQKTVVSPPSAALHGFDRASEEVAPSPARTMLGKPGGASEASGAASGEEARGGSESTAASPPPQVASWSELLGEEPGGAGAIDARRPEVEVDNALVSPEGARASRGWSAVLGEAPERRDPGARPQRSMTMSDHAHAADWAVKIEDDVPEAEDLMALAGEGVELRSSGVSGGWSSVEASEPGDEPPPTAAPPDNPPPDRSWAEGVKVTGPEPKPLAPLRGYGEREEEERGSPWLPAGLSLVMPGMGQVFNGQVLKGLLFGTTVWLVVPWVWSVWDAWSVAASPESPPPTRPFGWRLGRAALYAVVWAPITVFVCWQMALGLTRASTPEISEAELKRAESVLIARGEAGVVFARALYRGERQAREQEEELERSGSPKPGDPAYGLSPLERSRKARGLVLKGQAACGREAFGACRDFMEEALKLDPSNKDAWSFLVLARQRLGASGGP